MKNQRECVAGKVLLGLKITDGKYSSKEELSNRKTSCLVSYIDVTDLDFRKEGRLLRFEFLSILYSASQFYRSCKIFHGKFALSKLKFNMLSVFLFYMGFCFLFLRNCSVILDINNIEIIISFLRNT